MPTKPLAPLRGPAKTRREFIKDTTRAGLGAAAVAAIGPAAAAAAARRRNTVAVFGGGIAGLTAAHELAERGYEVTVYERRAWGGKARSTQAAGSASGGRRPLPGEHGYRIEFGFYQNLPDTLRRIPFGANAHGVFDNLVPGSQLSFARAGRRDLVLPAESLDPRPYTPQQVLDLIVGLLLQTDLPPQAVARFADRAAVFFSSCDERRRGEWQQANWRDFIAADSYTEDYYKLLALPFTQFVQASKAKDTSAAFSGLFLEELVYNILGRGANGAPFRMFDRPTNEAWIDPWIQYLHGQGVRLRIHHELARFELNDARITHAVLDGPRGREMVRADWYVCALPVERARALWTPAILAADPRLELMHQLQTGWMNGIQFYLRDRTPIVRGHVAYLDSPWLVSSISQAQFWTPDFASTYGDGHVRDCLSAICSDWNTPGVIYGKPARDCTPAQVAREVWEQMKSHLNDSGETVLTDDLLLSWRLDPGLIPVAGGLENQDPLVLPTAGSYLNRPAPTTAIANLLLCGDYLAGEAEVANMEAANYNARRAVNALLDQAGSDAPRCTVTGAYRPAEWEPLRQLDAERYRSGQPNILDTPLADATEDSLDSLLNRLPVLAAAR